MSKRVKAGTKGQTPAETVGPSLTPQQEKFAQLTAMGMNQSAAYREAYNAKRMKPESVHVNASKLAASAKVALRVAEIRKPVVEQARYGLKEAMTEAETAMQLGVALGQPAAVVSAVHLRSKLNGLMVEDRRNERDPFTELSDSELDRAIAEADRVLDATRGVDRKGARQGRTSTTH